MWRFARSVLQIRFFADNFTFMEIIRLYFVFNFKKIHHSRLLLIYEYREKYGSGKNWGNMPCQSNGLLPVF